MPGPCQHRRVRFFDRFVRQWDEAEQQRRRALAPARAPSGTGIALDALPWNGDPGYQWPPSVAVDGTPQTAAVWGVTWIGLEPGPHLIELSQRFGLQARAFAAALDVEVPPAGHVVVKYRSAGPPWRRGTIEVLASDATAGE
jgi:hypothetical protein